MEKFSTMIFISSLKSLNASLTFTRWTDKGIYALGKILKRRGEVGHCRNARLKIGFAFVCCKWSEVDTQVCVCVFGECSVVRNAAPRNVTVSSAGGAPARRAAAQTNSWYRCCHCLFYILYIRRTLDFPGYLWGSEARIIRILLYSSVGRLE